MSKHFGKLKRNIDGLEYQLEIRKNEWRLIFLADTNFLIYLHEGKPFVEPFLNYNFGVSFISEIELLGHKNISKQDEKSLRELLKDCFAFNFSEDIKLQTIKLKQKYTLKLPDAIIASTCIIF